MITLWYGSLGLNIEKFCLLYTYSSNSKAVSVAVAILFTFSCVNSEMESNLFWILSFRMPQRNLSHSRNDVLICLNLTDIHVWFLSTLCTISPSINKSTMPFQNKAPRNCAFQFLVNVYWVMPVCTQNWIAVRRSSSSSYVANVN